MKIELKNTNWGPKLSLKKLNTKNKIWKTWKK